MLRRLTLLTLAIVAFGLIACTGGKTTDDMNSSNDTTAAKRTTLVAYFSASGVTRGVAERLAKAADADLHEIAPEQPYTAADLDWHNAQSRSSLEMKDPGSRPAITGKIDNMAQYETVYVGFPIWWYTCPTIVNTFLEAYDFTGKRVIPFATSGGSSIAKAESDLRKAYPNAIWLPGKLLNSATDDQLKAWVDSVSTAK